MILALYPYQTEGAAWLADRRTGVLADQMGLGKTVQALHALPAGMPALVVCPAAVKGVWAAEAARWRPGLAARVLAGRGSFAWPAAGALAITNYDVLPDHAGPPPFGTILIADEAHALKSGRAARTKRFRRLADAVLARDGRVWLLTGTPCLNDAGDLWGVLRSGGIHLMGYQTYRRECRAHRNHWGGTVWGPPSPRVATALGEVMLRRTRAEVLPQLPAKTRQDVPVEIDASVRRTLDDVLAGLGEDVDAVLKTALATRAGAAFIDVSAARRAVAACKLAAALELATEHEVAGEPLVVFSAHRAPVEAFANRPGWAVLLGGASADMRGAVTASFQRGDLKGLAGTIGAMGTGLTLTRAARALFVDLAWTPALNAQAEDRVCRIGQDRGVVIQRLVADHELDRRVTAILDRKARHLAAAGLEE